MLRIMSMRILVCLVLTPAFTLTPAFAEEKPVAAREVPQEAYANFSLAMHLFNTRQFASALEIFKRVTELDPLAAKAYYYQGLLLRSRGLLEEAESALSKAVVLEADEYLFRTELGRVLMSRNQREEGLKQWEIAAEAAVAAGDNRYADVLYRQTAQGYNEAGQVEKAVALLLKTMEISSEPEVIADFISGLLSRQGRLDEAVGVYHKLLERDPDAVGVNLKIASHYEQAGEYENALSAYEAYLEAVPDNLEKYVVMVQAMETARKAGLTAKADLLLKQSIQLLEGTSEANPNDLRIHSRLAALLGLAGQTQRAIDVIEKGLKIAKGQQAVELNVMLANAYLDKAIPGKAEEALLSAMALEPSNAALRARLGSYYRNMMQMQDAIDSFRRAAGLSTGSAHLGYLVALAETYMNGKEYDLAEAEIGKVLNSNPDEVYAWGVLAKARNAGGNYEGAIPAARRMLEIENANLMMRINAHLLMAEAYEKLGDEASVKETYEKLVELATESGQAVAVAFLLHRTGAYKPAMLVLHSNLEDPDMRIHTMGLLADIYCRQGKIENAERIHSKLIEENPDDSEVYRYKARFFDKQKLYDEALAQYNEAAARDNDAQSRLGTSLGKAALYEAMGEYEKSEALYKTILEQHPDDPVANNNYAYFLSNRERDLEQALDMVLKSMRHDPDNAAYLDTYGWILHRMGRHDGALLKIHKAWQNQKDSEVGKHLGDVLTALGRVEQAIEIWQQALEIDPDNQLLIDRLEEAGALQVAD